MFSAFLGKVPREDFITYAADFFLDLEDVRWTIISGVVNEMMVISVRNLGYTRNAGEFVKRWFADIGSAGGHRAMAKAVVPSTASPTSSAPSTAPASNALIRTMVDQFLHDTNGVEKKPAVLQK